VTVGLNPKCRGGELGDEQNLRRKFWHEHRDGDRRSDHTPTTFRGWLQSGRGRCERGDEHDLRGEQRDERGDRDRWSDETRQALTGGTNASAIAVNPLTNNVYVANKGSNDVTVIAPTFAETSFLTTAIDELPGDTTYTSSAAIDLLATSATRQCPRAWSRFYFQVDTANGVWKPASPSGSGATAFTGGLTQGLHILYAFAADAQNATSTNTGSGSSPVAGKISAYVFLYRPLYSSGTYIGEVIGANASHTGAISLKLLKTGAFTGR